MLFDNLNKCLKNHQNLIYDEACLDIFNNLTVNVQIFGQYDECHECDPQNLAVLEANNSTSIVVNTRSPISLYYVSEGHQHCPFKRLLYEHYRYGWNITEQCTPIYIKEPADDVYLPILMAFVILFCFGTMWYMVKCIYKNSGRLRRLLLWSSETEENLGGSSAGTPLVIERAPSIRKHPHRIKSVDVFRGLSIILMIFINYGGGKYWFFEHSVWNGITIADLVFPWYVLMDNGVISVSFPSRSLETPPLPRRQIIFHIIRRSFVLIFIGLILNSNQNMSTIADLRFPGVLQRIGITYFIVGILEVIFTKRSEVENVSIIHDVATAWPQWIFCHLYGCYPYMCNISGRCAWMWERLLGSGGLDDGGRFMNCTGGAAGYIDRAIFGHHMYKKPPCNKLYETTVYYDPEGILGTLTSILTVYLGVQAGRILNTYQNVKAKVIRWIVWGLVTGLLGGALCGFSRDNGPIPLNKQLWSLSFTLVTSGMAFITQAFLFVTVDILRKWGGRPFFYPGMNAIVLYIGHSIMKDTFPFAWKPTTISHATYLFMDLWGTFLWVAISIFLYKRNIFLTI
ncbi:hypothetical protein NQ318_002375 [Aromia moschata]|uniref:Heparan-alpha-glucosaminide N-acetyltransferase n=1 Tax=Aromia moschata TaxID=1265417 RepID=A0AAV8YFF0_9CUCU|nr:hypothetical protein NQ318_002375 [Aromia moschata]